MRIRSRHTFRCERELVWQRLMDIDALGSIIPDSQGLKQIGNNHYQGYLPVKVAHFKGKVSTRFKLVEISEPRMFRLVLSGRGLGLDFDGAVTFRLKNKGTHTDVSCSGNLNFHHFILGFVKVEIHTRLKMTLNKLFRKIDAQCRDDRENNHAH